MRFYCKHCGRYVDSADVSYNVRAKPKHTRCGQLLKLEDAEEEPQKARYHQRAFGVISPEELEAWLRQE